MSSLLGAKVDDNEFGKANFTIMKFLISIQ